MRSLFNKYVSVCQKVGAFIYAPSSKQIQIMLFVLGITLLAVGFASGAIAQEDVGEYNDDRIAEAINRIITFLEGSFGALVMIVAGLGAILASAFGQYRAALGCLVIAVGTFILRSFVSTFFNTESLNDW